MNFDELINLISDSILLYKTSDEYTKRLLLKIEEDVYIYINDRGSGFLGFEYTNEMRQKTKDCNNKLELNDILIYEYNKKIPIHVTTEYFKLNNEYDFHNINPHFEYYLDELGESWEQNRNDSGYIIAHNLMLSIVLGLVINCDIKNAILKESASMHYEKKAHFASIYKINNFMDVSKLVVKDRILLSYKKYIEHFKNNSLEVSGGLLIDVINVKQYMDLDLSIKSNNCILYFDLKECAVDSIYEIDSCIEILRTFLNKSPNIVFTGLLISSDLYEYNDVYKCIMHILDSCYNLKSSNILKSKSRLLLNIKQEVGMRLYRILKLLLYQCEVYDMSLIENEVNELEDIYGYHE